MKSTLFYAIVMCIAVVAAPVLAAPVDLRSTMQFDQSLNADIVLSISNPDVANVQVNGARSSTSTSCLSLDVGPIATSCAIGGKPTPATGSEVAGLSVGTALSYLT